jgi:hypothetical protein
VKRSGLSNGSNFKKFDKAVNADNSHFFIYSGYMQDSKMAELNDGEDFIFTNSNVPLQIPTIL